MNSLVPMITEQDGKPVTTSRAVAEQFGKQHKNVIQAIESLRATLDETADGKEFSRLNFQPADYIDTQGKTRPAYILTKDGFTMLVMGFTGSKAMQFKIAYINAFNRMEQLLRSGAASIPAEALQGIERRLAALESHAGAQPTANSETLDAGDSFLQAIRAALNSGEYYLVEKGKRQQNKPKQGILLGVKSRKETILKAKLAYKVYAQSTKAPLSRVTLWGVLEQIGTIEPRGNGKAPMTADFPDSKKIGAIFITNDKLERK